MAHFSKSRRLFSVLKSCFLYVVLRKLGLQNVLHAPSLSYKVWHCCHYFSVSFHQYNVPLFAVAYGFHPPMLEEKRNVGPLFVTQYLYCSLFVIISIMVQKEGQLHATLPLFVILLCFIVLLFPLCCSQFVLLECCCRPPDLLHPRPQSQYVSEQHCVLSKPF